MHHPGYHPPLGGWLVGGLIALALAAIARTVRQRGGAADE